MGVCLFGDLVWLVCRGMEDNKQSDDAHLTSAAAFVEGGIQDACDDACSICLEDFSESDPSTVHLQLFKIFNDRPL